MLARIEQSIGMAFLFVPINAMAFAFIPKEKANRATGLINLARNIGGSFGIAAVTTLLARRAQFHQHVLVGHLTPFDDGYRAMLHGATQFFTNQGADPARAAKQAQGLLYGLLQRQASMLAIVDDFWLLGLAFLLLVPLMFLMKKSKPHAELPVVAD